MKRQDKARWALLQHHKDECIENPLSQLAALRAQANIIGISRWDYDAIENRKRTMLGSAYIDLTFFFIFMMETAQMLRMLGAYPVGRIERFNNDPMDEGDA